MHARTLCTGPAGAGRQALAAALLMAMLAACGGGGGSSPTAMMPVDPDPGTGNGGNMPDPGTGNGNGNGMNMPDPGNDNGNGGSMPAHSHMRAGSGAIANAEAADLADHWHIHRGTGALTTSLGLSPAPDHAAAQDSYAVIAKPAEIDTPPVMQVQGQRGGITVGRFTSGPADQLEITLDYDCSPGCYSTFPADQRPAIARAAKLWSHHILATMPPYQIDAGNPGAIEVNRGPLPPGTNSFTTRGVHVFVVEMDPDPIIGGYGANLAVEVGPDFYRGRTGIIAIAPRILAGNGSTAGIALQEIGHVLTEPTPNAYRGQGFRGPHLQYIDTATGTWTGPAVAATPGGERPAPFQGGANSGHSDWAREAGLSVLGHGGARLPGPYPLDTAYLTDLGYDVVPDAVADAPELYGYGAWGEDSGINIMVSRRLPTYVDDTLSGAANAFGTAPATAFANSHVGMSGTATWMGVLLGVDLHTEGLPPVTGDTTLSVALADLTGTVRFSGLEVLARGASADFRQTSLSYAFSIDGNTFGNNQAAADGRIEGSWYGDAHDEVAGTVHDTAANTGLLGAFIAER